MQVKTGIHEGQYVGREPSEYESISPRSGPDQSWNEPTGCERLGGAAALFALAVGLYVLDTLDDVRRKFFGRSEPGQLGIAGIHGILARGPDFPEPRTLTHICDPFPGAGIGDGIFEVQDDD